MTIFKRTLGWLIVVLFGIGVYAGISLSFPEFYSFPGGGIFGWMIPLSRWLIVPFVVGMFLSSCIVVVAFSFFMMWCFNGSWKEVWKDSPGG